MKTAKIKNKKILIAVLSAAFVLLTALIILIAWGNKALVLTEIRVESEKIPDSFSGYRIAQVSDLHNAEFGDENEKLLSMLKEADPDIIVMTGDLIDSRRPDVDIAADFMNRAADIAPCYYVTGNHEKRIPAEYSLFLEKLRGDGIFVLNDEAMTLEKGGDSMTLIGMQDHPADRPEELSALSDLCGGGGEYRIVLSHKPDFFKEYVASGADLVFCGHAHGGQFRIPFIGGVVPPGQGLFPEYTEGIYTEGETSMIVSRGLGNSIIPFRVNNRPEVVIVELSLKN